MEVKKVRAAIYARCKSLGPRGKIALEQQLDACYAYCSSQAYSISEQYVRYDIGVGDPMQAPQLSSLRRAATEGQIDVIVVASADRIDEMPAWQAVIIGELEPYHVRVESALERHGTHLVVEQIIKDTDMAVAQILQARAARNQRTKSRRRKGSRRK